MDQFYRQVISRNNIGRVRELVSSKYHIPANMVKDKDIFDMLGKALTAHGPLVEGSLWHIEIQEAGGERAFMAKKLGSINNMAAYELGQAIKSMYAMDEENYRRNIDWRHREILDYGVSDTGIRSRSHPLENYGHFW